MPAASTAGTIVLPYNDPAAVQAAFAEHGDEIACVITEAAPGNMGVVPPAPGFNRLLAETCAAHGALFVSDEVMTGFRVTRSGHYGLDGAVEGWRPDLLTFGKVMGGGFPAAAFGGRADVMSMLSPEGPVYQAGTLSGNPVATTAGLATLRLATDEVYAHLDKAAQGCARPPPPRSPRPGSRTSSQHVGSMFSVFFTDERVTEVRDFAGATAQHTDRFGRSSTRCSTRASTCRRSAFEVWFLSAAHDDRAVRPDRRRPPRSGARRGRRTRAGRRPDERADHGAPAAARRGAQPGRHPLRTAARLPPLRARR